MTCGESDSGLQHYLVYIRACTNAYKAYRNWTGDANLRGYHMHLHRRDWECAAALYKHYRRWEYLRKAVNEHFEGPK